MAQAENLRLSKSWKGSVWNIALFSAMAFGAIVGGKIATTLAGVALGAFIGLSVGALIALGLVALGAAMIRWIEPNGRTRLSRLACGATFGVFLLIILTAISTMLAGELSGSIPPILLGGFAGLVFGYFRPPTVELVSA